MARMTQEEALERCEGLGIPDGVQRRVYALWLMTKFSYGVLAEMLELSEASVRGALMRAKRRAREATERPLGLGTGTEAVIFESWRPRDYSGGAVLKECLANICVSEAYNPLRGLEEGGTAHIGAGMKATRLDPTVYAEVAALPGPEWFEWGRPGALE